MGKFLLESFNLRPITYFGIISGLVVILLIATTVQGAVAKVFWVYNMRQSIVFMNNAVTWSSPQFEDILPKQKDPSSNSMLQVALDHLIKAISWQTQNSQAYYLAGRIYAMQDRWPQAIDVFAHAYQLSPNTVLPGWVTLLVDERVNGHFSKSKPFYVNAGFNVRQLLFLQSADKELLQGNFDIANQNYQFFLKESQLNENSDLPSDVFFRAVMAAAMSGDYRAENLINDFHQQDEQFTIPVLVDELQLDGAQLRWMTPVDPPTVTFGTVLNYPYGGRIGTLWWAGQATALVSATQTGDYQINFNLRHSEPPPINIIIGVDGHPLHSIVLDNGNNRGEVASLNVKWSQGFHTINIWFLNNTDNAGKERDAIIDGIIIDRRVN